MARFKRRTKAQHARLFDDPYSMFEGVRVSLFNGRDNEMWFQTDDGYGFAITVNKGPVGIGYEVRAFVGTPKITAWGGYVVDESAPRGHRNLWHDDTQVGGVQYFKTERADQFKAWYAGETAEYPEREE